MCGGTTYKDRRPISPPPIIQLIFDYGYDVNIKEIDTSYLVVSAALFLVKEEEEEGDSLGGMQPAVAQCWEVQENLTGAMVSSAHMAVDAQEDLGIFFVFPDLCVKTEGTFRIKFSLLKLGNGNNMATITYPKTETFSDSFKVYSARKFPGMLDTTPLSRRLAEQGVKIPVRKDPQDRY